MFAFWDTSALAKAYVFEAGRDAVRSWLLRHAVVCSRLVPIELQSMLRRRRGEDRISAEEWLRALRQVAEDRLEWTMLEIGEVALSRAEALARDYPIRSLDAIHVASAELFQRRTAQPLPFLTADRRQAAAAAALGLDVQLIAGDG